MGTNNKYIIDKHFYLEEKCLQIIEKELQLFIDVRLKSVYLISELYVKGSIKKSEEILDLLSISNDNIENLIETVGCKISSEIDYSFTDLNICFNRESNIKELENNIDEFTRTEKAACLCEKVLDKSLSKIFKTHCSSKLIHYIFNKSNLSERILGCYSLKNQKSKHAKHIFEQLKGFLLNLKCELRNGLVSCTFYLLNSMNASEEKSTVA